MRWKKRTIRIAWTDNTFRTVIGHARGPLAVHANEMRGNQFNRTYSVTHLRTGLRVAKVRGRLPALRIVDVLKDLDWDFSDPHHASQATIKAAVAVRLEQKEVEKKNMTE